MRVLVACEESGIVRDAFLSRGHDAWSCDIQPTRSIPDRHLQRDVLEVIGLGWDLMIAHPPCTDLAVSGSRWFPAKIADGRQDRALVFVRALLDAPIGMIALENPVSVISSRIRKPDQIIQPWQFGHSETKATCLWLKGLPMLMATALVLPEYTITKNGKRVSRIHGMSPGPDRARKRSETYQGIADAMASQWG